MEFTKRRGLIIWLYTLKNITRLQHYGEIYYVSRLMKYVVMYVNEDKIESISKEVSKFHFVRAVELSHRPSIDMTFSQAVPEKYHEAVTNGLLSDGELGASVQ